jgi:hypothetical protein
MQALLGTGGVHCTFLLYDKPPEQGQLAGGIALELNWGMTSQHSCISYKRR